jgi:hypothetical protein
MFKFSMLATITMAMLAFSNNAKARDLPNNYLGFTFVTQNSGWLWCGGNGVCAQIYGNTIYFGIYAGNWNGATATNGNNDDGYFITELTTAN